VEQSNALCHEQGFFYWVAIGAIQYGRSLAEQGQLQEGLAQIRQGLSAFETTGTELQRPYWFSLLAETYGTAGRIKEGLNTLTEALTQVNNTGERFYEAELYRLKGALTLQSQVEEAEGYFLKAIEIAQRQQAKSLELRAAMSLARLWQRQGKKQQGHSMLSEIYGWFTEGFDTKDLQEAKTLLAELA
jgi:predicted ATPase